MRFMMIVKMTPGSPEHKNFEAGAPNDPKLEAAIGKLAEDTAKTGALVDMGGLLPTSLGARVRTSKGRLTITDGPFTEAKELVGGYAIMQTKSKKEAIELGRQFMQAHLDVLPSWEGELEIRQMFEAQ